MSLPTEFSIIICRVATICAVLVQNQLFIEIIHALRQTRHQKHNISIKEQLRGMLTKPTIVNNFVNNMRV